MSIGDAYDVVHETINHFDDNIDVNVNREVYRYVYAQLQ